MTFQLSTLPEFSQVDLALTPSVWNLSSKYGGPDTRLARLGDRWTLAVTCQGMSQQQGRAIVAEVTDGLTEKIRVVVPQPGVTPTTNGTFASGSGTSVVVSGSSPAKGDLFSLVHGGVHYLHRVRAVSGSTLTIQPHLKVAPTVGDVLNFQTPMIEGYIAEDSVHAMFNRTGVINLTFSVREAQ